MKRILLCEYRGGDTKVTVDGTALLIGISTDDMLERWDPAAGADTMPGEWNRRGAKRAKHARNATGTNTATALLAYLAVRDLHARVDFDEAAGRMWAVIDEASTQDGPC